jgi:hypothetical protein
LPATPHRRLGPGAYFGDFDSSLLTLAISIQVCLLWREPVKFFPSEGCVQKLLQVCYILLDRRSPFRLGEVAQRIGAQGRCRDLRRAHRGSFNGAPVKWTAGHARGPQKGDWRDDRHRQSPTPLPPGSNQIMVLPLTAGLPVPNEAAQV